MSAYVVVDASLAVKWVVAEPHSVEARAAADEWARAGLQPIAPALIFAEASNALYKRVRREDMLVEEAVALMRALLAVGVEPREEEGIHARAIELAHRLERPTPYDAHYLALAESEACECWTADERLWNAVKDSLPWVRWIGEYRPLTPAL